MKKSNKFFKIFLIIMAAFFVSFGIALVLFQNDKRVIFFAEQQLETFFNEAFECQFHAHINYVNLLGGTIELTDLAAVPLSGNIERWSWQAERAIISFSWLDLLFHQTFFLALELFGLHAYSQWDNGLALYEHILVYTKTPPMKPFLLEKFIINDGTGEFVDTKNNNKCSLNGRLVMWFTPFDTKTTLIIHDGFFMNNNKKIVEQCRGTLHQLKDTVIESKLTAKFMPFTPQAQELAATIRYDNNLSVNFCTTDNLCHGSLIVDENYKAQLKSEISLAAIKNFLFPKLPLEGTCVLSGDFYLQDAISGSGNCAIQNFSYASHALPIIQACWSLKDSIVSTTIDIDDHDSSTSILNCSGSWDIGKSFEGSGQFSTIFLLNDDQKKLTGNFTVTPEQCFLHAQSDEKLFSCSGTISSNGIKFSSFIDYSLVQKILPEKKIDLPGTGTLSCMGDYDYKTLSGKLLLRDAHIKLPNTYNLIKNFSTTFEITCNLEKFNGILRDSKIEFNKGEITSNEIALSGSYENKNFAFNHVHCPFIITDCFIGLNNDLFTLINGAGLFEYNEGKTTIKGQVILNQTHMSTNIFSSEFLPANQLITQNDNTENSDLTFDVLVQTKSPIHVKTPFLDIAGHINFVLKGSWQEPAIQGAVELVKGRLEFPYQPLFITHGKLSFNAQQPDNPLIELVARNTIKKYSITMTIEGTLQDPKINFSSSPDLDETAIISLLFGGVDDGSLSLVMPQMVMGSVRNLIFGTTANSSNLLNSLNMLIKPFKNIRLVPGFSDDTGRGGVRGSLMIEFDERLRAKIEQNFSLPEDVKIEVEYSISDDTIIRALRDERNDTGAEVEMRWKF